MTDFPPNPIEKPGYLLEFQEGFGGDSLNPDHWLPFYLPQWSSREKARAHYRLEDGQLVLQITEQQQPWCPDHNGAVKVSSLQTGVFSGPLGSAAGQHRFAKDLVVTEAQPSLRLYTPHFGYIELRAKGAANPNNVFAFWLIGFEDEPHRSAEICPFELKGWNIQDGKAVIGHGVRKFNDPAMVDEFYEDSLALDATRFHLYAVDWRPGAVDFYLDNQKIRSIAHSPDYPMQLMLNIYEIPASESGVQVEPTYPAEFVVDYVRGYRALTP